MSWVKRNKRLLFKPLLVVSLVLGAATASMSQVWGPLGLGVKGDPVAYTTEGEAIVLATENGENAHGKVFVLHVWNGVFWAKHSTFQTDSLGTISKMVYYKGKLYIAGKFHKVRNLPKAKNLIAYNVFTSKYESVVGLDANVSDFEYINDMVVYDTYLVVAGKLLRSKTVESQNMQAFNGLTWKHLNASLIGKGFNGEIFDLLVSGDTLFASGKFTSVNGTQSKYLFAFYGSGAKYYSSNTVKAYKLGLFDGKLVGAAENGSRSEVYFKGASGFRAPFSSPAIMYSIKDFVTYKKQLWFTGTFGLEIDSKKEIISLMNFDGDKWRGGPGYEQNYNLDFFMLYLDQLWGGGRKFIDNTPYILKTGKLHTDKGLIEGKIWHDRDSNCMVTQGDGVLNDRFIRVTPGNYYTRPDRNGNYSFFLTHGKYKVEVIQRPHWEVSSCSKEFLEVELDEGKNAFDQDFPLKFKSEIEDLKIKLTSYSGWLARKGGTQRYNIKTENQGSEKLRNGKIELTFNTDVNNSFISFPKPDTIDGNRVVYLVRSIESGQTLNIPFAMELPESFPEDQLDIMATLAPSANESSLDDNESLLTQVITDSTYENTKQVFPLPAEGETISKVSPDGELQYIINFANYSQDTVHTLHVIDTIDASIDLSRIDETGASHDYTTQVLNGPKGSDIGILVWTFNNLNLVPNPDRHNDMPGYSGYIGFKVGLKESIKLGTIIENQASLMFDYQHSEMTNKVVSEVANIISTGQSIDLGGVAVNLYPNPSDGVVTIEATQEDIQLNADEIVVLDAQGKEINVTAQEIGNVLQLNFTGFASGLYLIKGNSNQGIYKKTLILK